jgi:hypothetical protein
MATPVFWTPVSTAMAVTSGGWRLAKMDEKQPNIKPHQGSKRPLLNVGTY